MKSGQIKSFKDRVRDTETFKSWSYIEQKISLTRNGLKPIYDGLVQAQNMGLKKWEKQTGMRYRNIELVKELFKKTK